MRFRLSLYTQVRRITISAVKYCVLYLNFIESKTNKYDRRDVVWNGAKGKQIFLGFVHREFPRFDWKRKQTVDQSEVLLFKTRTRR